MHEQLITAFVYDKKGRLLSTGKNSYIKSHTLQAKAAKAVGLESKIFMHAEVASLVKVDWKKAHKIVVTRYGKDGRPLLAKPCIICQHLIAQTNIKIIEYTTGE